MNKNQKHIFLSTAGMSPQVITESLYAIAQDHTGTYHWPDELRIITTVTGGRKVREGLIELGHLARLCRELGKPVPVFDPDHHLLTIRDARGYAIDDARSVEAHNAVANFIMSQARELTADNETSLHASLAGGRKTMTFYMGYAMSMFGRGQDRLSHVLVDDGFENSQDFWFPTKAAEHRHITNQGRELDASTANVILADIPFIRHRHNLPDYLQQTGATEPVDFVRLVQLINLGDQPERIRVRLDNAKRQIIVADAQSALQEVFEPGLLEFAYYAMMAKATATGNADIRRPTTPDAEDETAELFLQMLQSICMPQIPVDPQDGLEDIVDRIEAWNDDQGLNQIQIKTLQALRSRGIKPQWFDDRKQKLKSAFQARLPANLVERVGVAIVFDEDGNRLQNNEARPKNGGYGINLPGHALQQPA